MYSYRSIKKHRGFITLQILMIFLFILFMTSILFKLSSYKLQKADTERMVIEFNLIGDAS